MDQDQVYEIKFHGNPVNILPLMNSKKEKITEKNKINEIFLLTKRLVAKIVKPKNKVLALGDNPNSCRHCQSEQYVKWGNESGIQRYKCKSSKKTYNHLTNTPLARLRKKEEWLSNANEMIKGSSLKTTGEICNIAISTAFHWRHKFLERWEGGGVW